MNQNGKVNILTLHPYYCPKCKSAQVEVNESEYEEGLLSLHCHDCYVHSMVDKADVS